MNDTDRISLEGLTTQWKHFSEYVEKLDTEHWHVFTIVFAAFSLFSVMGGEKGLPIMCWILPLTIMILFYYEAYRLREVAIMKGFLAKIEKLINSKYEEIKKEENNGKTSSCEDGELYNWYYSYEIVFMTNNNRANQFFPYPVLLTCLVVCILSGVYGWRIMNGSLLRTLFVVLNVVTVLFDALAICSIANTLRFSQAAFSENITKEQEEYRKAYQSKYKEFKFK